jgi:hypothetical protein
MDYERLIVLNRYTRDDIDALTFKRPGKPSVICVGNTMARKQLELHIKASIPTTVVGHGKYTAVMEICDRLELTHKDSFDGELFGQLPYMSPKTVLIVRDPPLKSKLLKEYINSSMRLVILSDKVYTKEVISLRKLTQRERDEYESLKGYPMVDNGGLTAIEREEQLVARHLKFGDVYPLPTSTHRWIARTFPKNAKILDICALAAQTDNPLYYHAVLSLIRYKKSIKLVYPKWVKRKQV